MAISYILPARGPLPEEKVVISEKSGEILWPIKDIHALAIGNSKRQYFAVLDKSTSLIGYVYEEIFGSPPPKLAAPRLCQHCFFLFPAPLIL